VVIGPYRLVSRELKKGDAVKVKTNRNAATE
jgi:hypothetical protein